MNTVRKVLTAGCAYAFVGLVACSQSDGAGQPSPSCSLAPVEKDDGGTLLSSIAAEHQPTPEETAYAALFLDMLGELSSSNTADALWQSPDFVAEGRTLENAYAQSLAKMCESGTASAQALPRIHLQDVGTVPCDQPCGITAPIFAECAGEVFDQLARKALEALPGGDTEAMKLTLDFHDALTAQSDFSHALAEYEAGKDSALLKAVVSSVSVLCAGANTVAPEVAGPVCGAFGVAYVVHVCLRTWQDANALKAQCESDHAANCNRAGNDGGTAADSSTPSGGGGSDCCDVSGGGGAFDPCTTPPNYVQCGTTHTDLPTGCTSLGDGTNWCCPTKVGAPCP